MHKLLDSQDHSGNYRCLSMVDALESLAQTKGLNYASSTTRQSNCGTPQRDAIMRRRGPCTCCAVKVAHRRAQSPSPYCIPRPHSAHVSYIRRIALSPTRRLHLLNMLPEDGKSQQPLVSASRLIGVHCTRPGPWSRIVSRCCCAEAHSVPLDSWTQRS